MQNKSGPLMESCHSKKIISGPYPRYQDFINKELRCYLSSEFWIIWTYLVFIRNSAIWVHSIFFCSFFKSIIFVKTRLQRWYVINSTSLFFMFPTFEQMNLGTRHSVHVAMYYNFGFKKIFWIENIKSRLMKYYDCPNI